MHYKFPIYVKAKQPSKKAKALLCVHLYVSVEKIKH